MTLLNPYLDLSPEVANALHADKPVVALESTIISHGMPYPQNVETARHCEQIVRDLGATPATIAIIGGRLKAGLSDSELEYFGKTGTTIHKASRRDLPILVSQGFDGATTVASTMIIAAITGIRVFATGGIGGVHRGAETSFDISADLQELARTDVAVVCAGVKSILDIGLTLETLETLGVPVIGYGTDELPAFYCRESGFPVDANLDTPERVAKMLQAKWGMGLSGGAIIANPIPADAAQDRRVMDAAIQQALQEADAQAIRGKANTPFLLNRVKELTGGDSLAANIALVYHNATVGAQIAVALAALVREGNQ